MREKHTLGAGHSPGVIEHVALAEKLEFGS